MANLQHYIHYKLQNKPIMFRSSKEGNKEGRKEGRKRRTEGWILHTHSLIQTHVESYYLPCGRWRVNMIHDLRMLKANYRSACMKWMQKLIANEAYIFVNGLHFWVHLKITSSSAGTEEKRKTKQNKTKMVQLMENWGERCSHIEELWVGKDQFVLTVR